VWGGEGGKPLFKCEITIEINNQMGGRFVDQMGVVQSVPWAQSVLIGGLFDSPTWGQLRAGLIETNFRDGPLQVWGCSLCSLGPITEAEGR